MAENNGMSAEDVYAILMHKIKQGGGNVDDVKVNGVSVVTNKIANIDLTKYQRYCNVNLSLVDENESQMASASVKIYNITSKALFGEYEYTGQPLNLSLPSEFVYRIECGYVSGYAEPLNYIFKAGALDLNITRQYNSDGVVYAFHVDGDENNPNNNISYLLDAIGATPAHMDFETGEFDWGSWENAFFLPKPCMLKSDGSVYCYLDPNDYTKKADGTASPVADVNFDGNAMMEWGQGGKRIWYKIVPDEESTSSATIYVADHKHDNDFRAWSFLDNNGALMDHFYTPIYCGSYDSSNKMRSISGMACGNNKQGSYELTAAQANNTTSAKEWNTEVLCDHQLIQILLMLIGKSTDMQATFGYGNYSGGSFASNLQASGTLNLKGMFYGEDSASNVGVKVFGMEHYWGNQWRRYLGHVTNSSGVQLYKLTWSLADGSTADGYNSSGSGYINSGIAKPDSGFIAKEKFGENGSMLPSVTTNGSSSTYYCDYYYTGNSCYAFHGGACDNGLYCGAFAVILSLAFSYTNWTVGAALSCKPLVPTNKE